MKWLEQQERMLQIQKCYSRESMDSIICYFVYVNLENSIDKMTSERIVLMTNFQNNSDNSDNSSETRKIVIPTEQVLQLIQSNRISTPKTKYIFQESFLYHVDLEPENLQQYVYGDNSDFSKRFLKVLPLLDDIVIPPSIFIFHHLNSLYFIFKEVMNKPAPALKSILKGSGTRKKMNKHISNTNLENIVFSPVENEENNGIQHHGSQNKKVTMKLLPKYQKGELKRIIKQRFTRKLMEISNTEMSTDRDDK